MLYTTPRFSHKLPPTRPSATKAMPCQYHVSTTWNILRTTWEEPPGGCLPHLRQIHPRPGVSAEAHLRHGHILDLYGGRSSPILKDWGRLPWPFSMDAALTYQLSSLRRKFPTHYLIQFYLCVSLVGHYWLGECVSISVGEVNNNRATQFICHKNCLTRFCSFHEHSKSRTYFKKKLLFILCRAIVALLGKRGQIKQHFFSYIVFDIYN